MDPATIRTAYNVGSAAYRGYETYRFIQDSARRFLGPELNAEMNSNKRKSEGGFLAVRGKRAKGKKTYLSNKTLTNMICPKFILKSVMTVASPWNVIDNVGHNLSTGAVGGAALMGGNRVFYTDQDFVQYLHNPVATYFNGIRRASMSPHALSYSHAMVNDIDGEQDLNTDVIPGDTNDDNFMNDNINGEMNYYTVEYTITGIGELPIEMEFTEVCPRTILYDKPSSSNSLAPAITVTSPFGTKDPLSALKRDLVEQEAYSQTRYAYSGPTDDPTLRAGSSFGNEGNIWDLDTRNVSLQTHARTNFRRDYKVLSQKKIIVDPGQSVKYVMKIPGYRQSAKRFSRYDNKFVVTSSFIDYEYNRLPLFDEHTRFLLIRTFCSKLVGSATSGTSFVGFGGGGYKIAQKISAQWTYIPQMQKSLNCQAAFDGDFHLDGTVLATSDIALNVQESLNMETNNNDQVHTLAL